MNFKNSDIDPPCGWVFKFKDEQGREHTTQGNNLSDLVQRTLEFCLVNNFEIPDELEARIVNFICALCPQGWCMDDRQFGLKLTPAQLLRGTQAIVCSYDPRNLEQDPREILARAECCRQCPFNVDLICPTCDRAKLLFSRRLQRAELLSDDTLHNCVVCGCFICVKVQFSAEALRKQAKTDELYPTTFVSKTDGQPHACWLHKALEGASNAPA